MNHISFHLSHFSRFPHPSISLRIIPSYKLNVPATYVQPPNYVRHIKRIGDEIDPSIDYSIEDEDIAWINKNPRFAANPEAQGYLTHEAFETIINILERATGAHPREPAPLYGRADRSIMEVLQWPLNVANIIIPDVYDYWLAKREKLQKPLNRRYWPCTSSTDTNPHHVFRPRGTERYRLRRQHRKNDFESFRKMQQLRKEFGRARILLQLLQERERLREAELEIQKEIFEQTIYDLTTDGSKPRREVPYRHTLLFQHLLQQGRSVQEEELEETADSKLNLVVNRSLMRSGVGEGTGGLEKLKRDRKSEGGSSSLRKRSSSSRSGGGGGGGGDDDEEGEEKEKVEAPPVIIIPEGVPGPRVLCRPSWPSFMSSLPIRDVEASTQKSLSQYLDDLELKPDKPLIGFRCRNRVGRGGRIIVDRIPVYDDNDGDDYAGDSSSAPLHYKSGILDHSYSGSDYRNTKSHVYLEMGEPLRSYKISPNGELIMTPPPPTMSSISRSASSIVQANFSHSLLLSHLPVMCPPARSTYSTMLSAREHEIYNISDDEDEKVEWTRTRGGGAGSTRKASLFTQHEQDSGVQKRVKFYAQA